MLSISRYLLVQLVHLPQTFHLSELLQNKKPFWILSQNSEYPRIFWVTGANQNARKLLSTDLVNTKKSYALKLEKCVIIIHTSQNIKPLHHAVAAQWTPLLGILFEEVFSPYNKRSWTLCTHWLHFRFVCLRWRYFFRFRLANSRSFLVSRNEAVRDRDLNPLIALKPIKIFSSKIPLAFHASKLHNCKYPKKMGGSQPKHHKTAKILG